MQVILAVYDMNDSVLYLLYSCALLFTSNIKGDAWPSSNFLAVADPEFSGMGGGHK